MFICVAQNGLQIQTKHSIPKLRHGFVWLRYLSVHSNYKIVKPEDDSLECLFYYDNSFVQAAFVKQYYI